jgi:hypothetical protein
MFLVFVLQHPKAIITHVSIMGSPVISLGNVHILSSIIQIFRRLPEINNRVKLRIRTVTKLLRRAERKRRRDGFSVLKPGRFQKGNP